MWNGRRFNEQASSRRLVSASVHAGGIAGGYHHHRNPHEPAIASGPSAREAARRATCQSHLRQVGIALATFENVHGVYPASGWTTTGPGNPAGKYVGWRSLLLPYLEQTNLQRLYDFDNHWWDGTNPTVAAVPVPNFLCPSVPHRAEVLTAIAKRPRPALVFSNPIAATDYEAVMGVQPSSINSHLTTPIYNGDNRYSIMYRNSTTRIVEVTDGTSSTVAVVECGSRPNVFRHRRWEPTLSNDQGIGWADSEGPFSLDGAQRDGSAEGCGPAGGCTSAINARNDNEPYSFHPGGMNALFVDGHVQFIEESIELLGFAALCTKGARESGSRRSLQRVSRLVEPELVGRVVKRDDILGRDVGLDIVDVVEDVAAARLPDFQVAADVLADFRGRSVGRTCWASMPPPQKTSCCPNCCLRVAGSMFAALICTGFRMWMPLSIRSGRYCRQEPQVWYQILAGVRERMYCTSVFCRGLTMRR